MRSQVRVLLPPPTPKPYCLVGFFFCRWCRQQARRCVLHHTPCVPCDHGHTARSALKCKHFRSADERVLPIRHTQPEKNFQKDNAQYLRVVRDPFGETGRSFALQTACTVALFLLSLVFATVSKVRSAPVAVYIKSFITYILKKFSHIKARIFIFYIAKIYMSCFSATAITFFL